MIFFTVFLLLGLPGVARTSRLDARQNGPSGNSSVVLPLPSLSSQKGSFKADGVDFRDTQYL